MPISIAITCGVFTAPLFKREGEAVTPANSFPLSLNPICRGGEIPERAGFRDRRVNRYIPTRGLLNCVDTVTVRPHRNSSYITDVQGWLAVRSGEGRGVGGLSRTGINMQINKDRATLLCLKPAYLCSNPSFPRYSKEGTQGVKPWSPLGFTNEPVRGP